MFRKYRLYALGMEKLSCRLEGQFIRCGHKVPTIMPEAITSQDLWIWHAFFGVAGSNNDINVLNRSPFFDNVLQGYAPHVQFVVNET